MKFKNEVLKACEIYEQILEKIGIVIGYENLYNQPIYEQLDDYWEINGNELCIDIDGEEYSYIISSYSSKGTHFYTGVSEDVMYVMAYEEQEGCSHSAIYMLDLKKEIKE